MSNTVPSGNIDPTLPIPPSAQPARLDALVTAVQEIGARLKQSPPCIDALLGLTRLMARQRGLYPA